MSVASSQRPSLLRVIVAYGTIFNFWEEIRSNDHVFAGLILLLVGAIGFVANVIGVYTVYRCRHLHNSFGFLCLSHCIANSGVCLTFAAWCAPTTILEAGLQLTSSTLGKHVGQVNIMFWDACVYSHLSISINRFICINFPIQAKNFFTTPVICVFIGVPWVLAVCHIVPYFWVNECFIYYDPMTWTWDYAETLCGNYISIYFDFYTGLGVFSAMFVFDMGTLLKLKIIHHKAAVFTDVRWRQRKQETRFFCQSLCQSAIFGIELIFFSSTFAWVACHAADGLILDLFHTRRAFKVQQKHDTNSANFHTIQEHHPQPHVAHAGDNDF
ncbi:srx-13 [Pristionchus pacificus]|uniref:Srx-13 n=1 Tax=Pristionchus pacificus TaxID=54126 RepID=A0A2A6CXN7_PRIPA|nr:srx-13 [Pristionchus pacificus]|eukprot:PDM82898.1 srx-13 [Pristionchus pacificus]